VRKDAIVAAIEHAGRTNVGEALAKSDAMVIGDVPARALRAIDPSRRYSMARDLGAQLRERESLSANQIDVMVNAYRRRMVAFSAETQARTAALDSVKLGQDLSWREAIDKGFVDGASLMKTWVQVDRPTKREEHIPLHGETVPFDSPYSNGQMIPGETDYNCACESVVFAGRGGT